MPDPLTDCIAGYVSGAVGIAIGNPLDILKVKLQNSAASTRLVGSLRLSGPDELLLSSSSSSSLSTDSVPSTTRIQTGREVTGYRYLQSLLHGVAAPILGYGALNALLFASYSVTLRVLDEFTPTIPDVAKIFTAGTIAGLSTVVISAPTEVIKCRAQVSHGSIRPGGTTKKTVGLSSWTVCKEILKREGVAGCFKGGLVTGFRDGFGYGVYFWAYGAAKNWKIVEVETSVQHVLHLLIAGGIAGCMSWASIYPLDVIKTRYQAQLANDASLHPSERYTSSWDCARKTYRAGGVRCFFRGISVTMVRAFLVNAVQFGTYEWMVNILEGGG
ncbi:mitochondrial carrier domain-containing protein [Lipomyces kononenkoae]|uniref:Mitochondrial carrier domain-containing protein n=1 Tax=Lipomyces kononenkoae TaxID=34357 RepID=A0ACC3TBD3_LIPKO